MEIRYLHHTSCSSVPISLYQPHLPSHPLIYPLLLSSRVALSPNIPPAILHCFCIVVVEVVRRYHPAGRCSHQLSQFSLSDCKSEAFRSFLLHSFILSLPHQLCQRFCYIAFGHLARNYTITIPVTCAQSSRPQEPQLAS